MAKPVQTNRNKVRIEYMDNKKLACLFASQLLYAAFGHIYHKSVLNSQTVLPLWTFVHTVQMNCGYWSDFRQIEELTFHIERVKMFSN